MPRFVVDRPVRRRSSPPTPASEPFRRAESISRLALNTTKQRRRYKTDLPPEVMEVLRWHVRTQLETPEQEGSDLLFPSVTGGFRCVTVLSKAFREVGRELRLGFTFTPRGMRRTFNDLARAASIEAIVTRSISGHLTEDMQNHYSTVRGPEQREGIARVVDLMKGRNDGAGGASSGAQVPEVVLPRAPEVGKLLN